MIRAALLVLALTAPARAAQVFGPASTFPNSISSLTVTSSGALIYSLTTSSSIHILSGGIRWPDGSFSTAAAGGGGSTDLTEVGAATAALQAQFVTVGASTMSIAAATTTLGVNLAATAASTQTLSLAVGASTASLQSQLVTVGASTATIAANLATTAASTQTLATAVGASTASLQSQLVTVGASTTTLQAQFVTVGVSTAGLAVATTSANTQFTSVGVSTMAIAAATTTLGASSLTGGLTGALPIWTSATSLGNSAFVQGTSSVTVDAAHQVLIQSTLTAKSQANFTNAVSTQVVFKGFAPSDGVDAVDNGSIQVGGAAAGSLLLEHFNAGAFHETRIAQTWDDPTGQMNFRMKTSGASPTNPLRLLGTGAVQVLPSGGGPVTPFAVGSTMTLSSNGVLLLPVAGSSIGVVNSNPSAPFALGATVGPRILAYDNGSTEFAGLGVDMGSTFGLALFGGSNSLTFGRAGTSLATMSSGFREYGSFTNAGGFRVAAGASDSTAFAVGSTMTLSSNGLLSVTGVINSTQAIFSGGSAYAGNDSLSGQIVLGNNAVAQGRWATDGNRDVRFDNTWDNSSSDIIFGVRTDGTGLYPFKIQGTGIPLFTNTASTQFISIGWAPYANTDSGTGAIAIGAGTNVGMLLSADGNRDVHIDNIFDNASTKMDFGMRPLSGGSTKALTPLRLAGDGAVTVGALPATGYPAATPFSVGPSTFSINSNGLVTAKAATFSEMVTVSSGIIAGSTVASAGPGAAGAAVTATCAAGFFATGGGCDCTEGTTPTDRRSEPNTLTGAAPTGWTCEVNGAVGGVCSARAVCSRLQ